MGDKQRKNVRCKVRGGISDTEKLNDRPTDTFSGEAGGDMSVPRRRTNGTAPGRVACLEWQRERNATAITTDRAVEEPSSTAFLCRYRKATPYNSSLQLLELCGDV